MKIPPQISKKITENSENLHLLLVELRSLKVTFHHPSGLTESEGNSTKLQALQEEYRDEYEALSPEEKAELIEEFDAHKQEGLKIRRPMARARIQDVANVARNIQLLVSNKQFPWFLQQ